MPTIELKISGMMCDACVSHVSQALQKVPGVQSAVVDLPGGWARVEGDPLDIPTLVAVVEEEGYTAQQL